MKKNLTSFWKKKKVYRSKDYHEDLGYVLFIHFDDNDYRGPFKVCLDCSFVDLEYWQYFINLDTKNIVTQAEKLRDEKDNNTNKNNENDF